MTESTVQPKAFCFPYISHQTSLKAAATPHRPVSQRKPAPGGREERGHSCTEGPPRSRGREKTGPPQDRLERALIQPCVEKAPKLCSVLAEYIVFSVNTTVEEGRVGVGTGGRSRCDAQGGEAQAPGSAGQALKAQHPRTGSETQLPHLHCNRGIGEQHLCREAAIT